jgi:branched-chain amino acid transport system substrate-binding protein
MKGSARSAAFGAVAVFALVLAVTASGGTSSVSRAGSADRSQAVTNYLAYVHGHKGKANRHLSKVYIGWVNQQGGQVVIGGLATAGAQLAVKYINAQLGGVGGHPVALLPCFIASAEDEGTTCGQKFVNNKKVSVVDVGAVATGIQSLYATIHGAKPVIAGVAVTPVDGVQKNAAILFGDTTKILTPFGTYAASVLHAKTAALVYPNEVGVTVAAQQIIKGLQAAGVKVTSVGYTPGQSDLTGPLTAAGATTADMVIPYGTAADCANQANGLKQLGITDSKKIVSAPLCLNSEVASALGDYPLWTYAIASSLFGDPTDKGMPAYMALVKKYGAMKSAPDPWFMVAFSQILTTDRFLNQVGFANITPAKVQKVAKAFRGPLALGAPKLRCGQFKDAPAVCNDRAQFFTYNGKFQFAKAAGWLQPPPGA